LFISTEDGPIDFSGWTPRQLELLEIARQAGASFNKDEFSEEEEEEDDYWAP
jgi:hypothetical protein